MVSTASDLPPFVTFTTGAELLVALGIDPHATGDSVRYDARTRKNWVFGEGRPYPYGKVSNARTMETKAFLDYYRANPPGPGRRGPDKAPRARPKESS